jgi:hypothetical protein
VVPAEFATAIDNSRLRMLLDVYDDPLSQVVAVVLTTLPADPFPYSYSDLLVSFGM